MTCPKLDVPVLSLAIRCLAMLLLALAGASPAWSQEKSVNPDINKSFQAPDPAQFIERFEKEGREVYDQREAIVAATGVKPGMAIADVGAGTGLFTRLFAQHVGPQGRVMAVDIAQNFLDHIEASCRQAELKNVVTVLCKQDSVELPAESVDLVFLCDTYHHFEFPEKTMRSIHRALRPDGQLVLIDFKRVEGESSDWILGHVRAGQETFTKEIVAAGFQQVEEKSLLKDNYFVRFKKIADKEKTGLREPPALLPLPRAPFEPQANPATPAKVALGKQLFFDPRLSGDNTMSCSTCHLPEKAFADGRARSPGHQGKLLDRNTPTVLNAGFFDSLFWDGRAASLEEQALGPITSPLEMNQDLDQLVQELRDVPGYREQFRTVFAGDVTREGIAAALAAFQRTLVTGPSALDRFLAGDKQALSAAARHGYELFIGDAGCVRCHHGPLLSDGKFYRLGVSYRDAGRAGVTENPQDKHRFRTPSLRNVAETGPYMHDGSMSTLYEVVTYYYRGVPTDAPEDLKLDIEPLLGQSFSDIDDLVEFLKSLSGEVPRVDPPQLP